MLEFLQGFESDAGRGFSLEKKQVSASHPTSHSMSLAQEGHAALERRDFTAAKDALARVTQVNPADPGAWNDLGLAYLGLHQLDKAEDAFKRQIAVAPMHRFAYNNLGRVYLAQDVVDKAIVEFRKQLEIDSRDQFAHGNLSRALGLKGEWKEAEKEAAIANEIWPKNPGCWLYLGRAQAKLGKPEEARKSFDRALQEGDNTTIQNDVAYYLADSGIDLEKAWQLVSSAISVESSQVCNPETLVEDKGCTERLVRLSASLDTAGWVLAKQARPERALPYLTSAYAISPRVANALHLAFVSAKTGKLDDALQLYAAAQSARTFKQEDAKPVQEELAKQAGGETALEERLRSLRENGIPLGSIGSLPAIAGDNTASSKKYNLFRAGRR